MTISSISVSANAVNDSSVIGTAVLAKSLDTAQTSGEAMVQMMEQSVRPYLGTKVDLRV